MVRGRAAGRFMREVFRPLPTAGDAWNVVTDASSLVVPGGLGLIIQPWPWGLIGLLAGALGLVGWAGVRLQAAALRGEEVDLVVEPLDPAVFQPARGSGPYIQFSVRVSNRGPDGRFSARVNSEIEGWDYPPRHGHFAIPWEGTATEVAPIESGASKDMHLARLYVETGQIHFLVPPEQGKPWELGNGTNQPFTRDTELRFELRVRDVDRHAPDGGPRAVLAYPNRKPYEPSPLVPLLTLAPPEPDAAKRRPGWLRRRRERRRRD